MSDYVDPTALLLWTAALDWMTGDTDALLGTARAMQDGTWWVPHGERQMAESETGLVYVKFEQLRREVGVLRAKAKTGVKFRVRSADELADRIRPVADRIGLLIYPVGAEGKGHVVDNGTLAEVVITLRIRCVHDGSYFDIQGFGLGADNQDKAGGKAATYAWKAALVQALTAGGEKDTDDTDTPIAGGVRPRGQRPADAPQPGVTYEQVAGAIAEARAGKDLERLKRAAQSAKALTEAEQTQLAGVIKAAATEIRGAA